MFILMGEAEKISPPKVGTFLCPICKDNRNYTHHHSTSYFTFFGIKITKLNTLSDYVSCSECTNCFSPKIITSPQQSYQATNHQVMFRVLCYLLSGYGDTIQSRERLLAIFKKMTGQEFTQTNINEELAIIVSGNAPTLPFLTENTLLISPLQKHQLIVAAYKFVDGSCLIEHQDRVRINTIGSSVGLSLPEIEYLIVNNNQ